MILDKKLIAVREDISKGLKTRAMNRLHGLINAYPNEIKFREELGKLYLSVEWKEKAGLYLLLSNTKDQFEKEAIEIYKSSVNNSGYKILTDLKFKGDKDRIPDHSKKVLENLEQKSLKETKTIPKYTHHPPNGTIRGNTIKETWKEKLGIIMIVSLVVSIPILAIIGLIQVVKWLYL